MSMREKILRIVASGAASIAEGVMEPRDVVDEIFDALLEPTDGMIAAAYDNAGCIGDNGGDERGTVAEEFIEMIRAAKAGA